jgi:hypothetical protein
MTAARAVATTFGSPSIRTVGVPVQGAQQYGRRCRVEIGGPVVPNNFSSTGLSRDKLLVNEEADDLRIKFKVERTGLWTPNIGHVEVYGLNEVDRKFAQHKSVPVALYAGYGTDLKLVAIFNAVQVNSKHDGAEWVTKFEGGEGHRSFVNAHASASFSAGTPIGKAITQFGQLLGKIPASSQATINQASAGRSFRNGYAVHKKAEKAFKELCDHLAVEPCFSGDEIIIAPKGSTTQDVFVITPDTGLVGSPEYASQPQPGKPQLLKVKVMLNPLLRVKGLVILESAAHSGRYRIATLTHEGDSYGGTWYTDLELQGLKGAK